jgi:signal peptidase I
MTSKQEEAIESIIPKKTLKPNLITYTGSSMNPTLRSGDGLQVEPYEAKKIRPGDVIVFNSPEDGRKITHRVISARSEGIKTRGDNNKNIDPRILSPEGIIGRVIYAQRGNKRKKIFGGAGGQLFSAGIRLIKVLDSRITTLLRPAYRWMVRTGLLRRLLNIQINLMVITLNRPGGTELQLLIGRNVIGRLLPGKTQWHLRRPFRLIVDEESLPTIGLRDK